MAKVSAILTATAKEKGVKSLNRELDKLFKTGQKLDRLKLKIGGSTSQLSATERAIRNISRDLNNLQSKRIRIFADTSGASGEIRTLNTLIATIKEAQHVKVTADTTGATADIRLLNELVKGIKEVEHLKVTSDTTDATADIRALNTLVSGIKEVESIKINVDTTLAKTEIENLQAQARQDQIFHVRATGGGAGAGGTGDFNSGMFRSFGRDFAHGFRGALGGMMFEGAARAGRTAGQGILRADEVDALARSAGVDVETLRESVRKATDEFKGAPVAEIMESSIEQASFARQRVDDMVAKGTLKAADAQSEYQKQLDQITTRVARNTQVLMTASGDAATGAEQARQLEKALAITGVQTDPAMAKKYSESILRAVVASGFDVAPDEIKRSLQQMKGPLASQVSEVGLARLTLMRDEGGKAATAAVRMFYDGMTSQGINEADMKTQIAAGIRSTKGMSTIATDMWKDPVDLVTKVMIPAAEKAKVDLDDAVAVSSFYQEHFGLTPTRAEFATTATVQRDQLELERQRIAAVSPQKLAEQATLRVELANIEAKFQDAASSLTRDFMPQIKAGAGQLSEMFKVAAKPGKTMEDYTKLSQAALGATVAGAVPALLDPATRPLTLAGIGLQVAGTVMLTAANELTGAADAMISWFTGKPTDRAVAEQAQKASIIAAYRQYGETRMAPEARYDPMTAELMKIETDLQIMREGNRADTDLFRSLSDRAAELRTQMEKAGIPPLVTTPVQPVLPPVEEKGWLQQLFGMKQPPYKRPGEDITALDTQWTAAISESKISIAAAFSEGGVTAGQSIATSMEAAGPGIGNTIASGIAAMASTIGSQIGSAAAAQINTARVNVTYNASGGVDTGAQTVQ